MNNNTYLKWIIPSIKNRTVPSKIKENEFNFRIEKAREQMSNGWVDKDVIIAHVNEFLYSMEMEKSENPCIKPKKREKRRINYSKINVDNKKDIVWIKFTKNKYISVIGIGCDISFSDYAKEHTTAGRIIKHLGLDWDDEEVLIFPLKNIPKGLNSSDIESGIGNYLISKNVPILDFYSHNY